ncbi:nitronate monooxygenase [Sinobaca sp. H24]|uniref:nitronate monooxygenase n=1 Tax=Sinobaca sp. H24 TaxID=2923376 RepID=UPI002079AE89|nr:nitronate monooxygenase [Sinobaca sp. H24]
MGGLSGPAVKPIIVRMIYQTAQVTSIPIIGCGGIMNGKDALEMIIAGASAVQIGTGSFIQPTMMIDVLSDINDYMERHDIENINDLVGSIQL